MVGTYTTTRGGNQQQTAKEADMTNIMTQLSNALATLNVSDRTDVMVVTAATMRGEPEDVRKKLLTGVATALGLDSPTSKSYTPKSGGYWIRSVSEINPSENNGYCISKGDFVKKLKDYAGSDPIVVCVRGSTKMIAIGKRKDGNDWSFTYPDSGNDGVVKDFECDAVYSNWTDAKNHLIGGGIKVAA